MISAKYKRLGKNSLYTFIGNIGSKFIGFIMLPFYTRWLTVPDFGTIDLITSYSTILYDLFSLCICSAIFIFPKDVNKELQVKYFTSGLFGSIIIIAAFNILFYFAIVFFIPEGNVLHSRYGLICIMSFSLFIQNYTQQFLRSIDKIKLYSVVGLVYSLSCAAFSFYYVPNYGVTGYVISMTIAAIISVILTSIFGNLFSYIAINGFCMSKYREMLVFSFPLIANILITFVQNYSNRPIMESFMGLESMGHFAVANKLPSILSMFVPVFALSWQISVTEEMKTKDYTTFYNNVLRFSVLCLFILSLLLLPFYPLLMSMLTSPEYHQSWIYIPLLTMSVIFNYMGYFHGANFTATKKSRYFLYSGIISSAVALLLNVILIMQFGMWGAVIALSLSSIAFSLTRYYYSRRFVQVFHWMKYLVMIVVYLLCVSIIILYQSEKWIYYLVSLLGIVVLLINNRDLTVFVFDQIKRIKYVQ